ncbi:hypothetical protein [Sphingosinicella sp.]|uniref:hypothetical protein n=1 Tax=Sphingosinicella sp. TaxID=1917971 RepID=UPI0035ADA5F5
MATAGSIAVTMTDPCEAVRSWQLCARQGDDYLFTTHCQLPNGSLLKLKIRPAGNQMWVVSDGGAALDEAVASGISKPAFNLNVRRAIRLKGLSFVEGRIESPRIELSSLFAATVVVANASRDVAEALLMVGSDASERNLSRRTREILVAKFPNWVSAKPVSISGASDRLHKFDNTLDLPDGRRLLVDVVKHQGNSINSAIVANLDVRRLQNPRFVQRIVFDPEELWKPEEIELLEVGATPVALPSLVDSVNRLVA